MKTITVSLYNRLEYTKRLFEHLDRCSLIDEYNIFICCEPNDLRVIDLAKSFRPRQTTVMVNAVRLGCNTNIFKAIATGFERCDYNIHFEDDTIPSRDCLRFFEWANSKYRHDSSVFTVCGYVNSNNRTEHYRPMSIDPENICRRKWFTPWGWATWRDRFVEMKKAWDFSGKYGSWDCTINSIRMDRYEIFPAIARVQNIGAENATHVPSAEWHKTHHFNEYWMESNPNLFMNKYNFYKEKNTSEDFCSNPSALCRPWDL